MIQLFVTQTHARSSSESLPIKITHKLKEKQYRHASYLGGKPTFIKMKAACYLRAQNFEAPSIKVAKNQSKKSHEGKNCRTNIMFDNHVCRGNTYSNPIITEDQKRNQGVYERERLARLHIAKIRKNLQVRQTIKPSYLQSPFCCLTLSI